MRFLPKRDIIRGTVEATTVYRRGDVTLDVLTINGQTYFGGQTSAKTGDAVEAELTRLPQIYDLFCHAFRYARRELNADGNPATQFHRVNVLR